MTRRNNRNVARKASSRNTFGGGLENLETRQMFSASPASFYIVPLDNGAKEELVCDLTTPSENVSVNSFYDGIQVYCNGHLANLFGNYAYFSLVAQSGNNSIVIAQNMTVPTCVWAGTGNDLISTGSNDDSLHAGIGDDTLVALGGVNNNLYAGTGYTNMWATYGNWYYGSSGTLVTHFFQQFANTDDISLDGNPVAEPGTGTQTPVPNSWQNFSNLPLFTNAGPKASDVVQGECGDCYFLSALAAVANVDPQQIRNSITPLGDGTYAEEFFENGQATYVRVDGWLPAENGVPFYAQTGNPQLNQISMWVPLMEKGWTYVESMEQGNAANYGNIEGGYSDEALSALVGNGAQGSYNVNTGYAEPLSEMFGNAQYFAGWVNWELQQGKAVQMAFNDGNSSDFFSIPGLLINDHEYTVMSDTFNNAGQISGFWVRNPWGVDLTNGDGGAAEMAPAGHNDGQDDGMVWISVDEAWSVAVDVGSIAC